MKKMKKKDLEAEQSHEAEDLQSDAGFQRIRVIEESIDEGVANDVVSKIVKPTLSLASSMDNEGYKYKISIIMSVYNVEEFIDEAVISVINQDIGFEENVQIVMVDDGSPDRSGEICDKYKEMYPNNIVVVHKENGGLSSARNEGLKHVEGRYVNFFDPDDILTETALSEVYSFFSLNDKNVDIVSIPLIYFGDSNGPHHLNDKFKDGTRVINLQKQYQYIQLSLASAFVKLDYAKQMFFDDQLVIAEDAEQILKILLKNPFLGVVSKCKYMYRRRGGSQVTAGSTKKGWYNDYLKLFSLKCLYRARDMFGYIPKFVQNAVMCDLQWRLVEQEIPRILDEEELKEYRSLIKECLSLIEDDVLMRQKHLMIDIKIKLLSEKYGVDRFVSNTYDNVFYGFDNRIDHRFSNNNLQLSFLEITDTEVRITARQVVFAIDQIQSVYLTVNDQRIDAENVTMVDHVKCIGEVVSKYCMFDFVIPRALFVEEANNISFFMEINGTFVRNNHLSAGRFFPVSTKYKNAYYNEDRLLFFIRRNRLVIKNATKREIRACEKQFRRELWKSNKIGERKAVIARTLARLYRFFHRKPLWIISDRLNKAGDNGEALFRYMVENKVSGVNYYYAITECPDYEKMKPLGRVLNRNTLKYKVLHLASDCIISSHADEFVTNPFSYYRYPYTDFLAKKNFVFLQHGVTKDDISGWLNKYNKNIKGFIVAAFPEEKSMFEYDYFYDKKDIWLTGFARFDRLYHDEKKYITLMPTWRQYLMNGYDNKNGVWRIGDTFKESEYYRFYNSLINDERLLSACDEYGYKLAFMPHPNIIPNISVFDHDKRVKFFSIDDEYRKIYAQSNLVLTDYSSAVFDFAYLRKPLVYAQFDKEEFFAGSHVYTKGYFDYERDGFGEVVYDLDSTVDLLIDYMKNGCELKAEYRERIDHFFAFNDQNNCKRILDKLLELK